MNVICQCPEEELRIGTPKLRLLFLIHITIFDRCKQVTYKFLFCCVFAHAKQHDLLSLRSWLFELRNLRDSLSYLVTHKFYSTIPHLTYELLDINHDHYPRFWFGSFSLISGHQARRRAMLKLFLGMEDMKQGKTKYDRFPVTLGQDPYMLVAI